MKILFTGGGTGGHFYPIIAVAQAIHEIADAEKLVDIELYYMSDNPYDKRLLFENNIIYSEVPAGKLRRYFSFKNILDFFRTVSGVLRAVGKLYAIYPDVVFGKGGYASFPALVAARILRIPVIIHESDSKPGRVNLWASKFAQKIAISYPEAANYFPKNKTALTGTPLRKEILSPITHGAYEFLELERDTPIIFVTGGSQGALNINDAIIDIVPQLVDKFQIIHQTGKANFIEAERRAKFLLELNQNKNRYKPFAYLNETALRMIGGIANIAITRAGSTIFELAAWGIPSIVIPIPEDISHDQRTNAFAYARSGAAIVIEEKNLSGTILLSEIERLFSSPDLLDEMKKKAMVFSPKDAALKIAKELITTGLSHE
ncbi:MAG: UDP-N-acetylglucosamine--N-acetylmuramyl-(pentapeptide) pyrophosphoryl-undecaprenol N-acetylglucosamine transferase [Candidatus Vogelbacteria bacterium]|nr:UDP-N-acetylglucosamine--N-acetylmuramyl-(pentapeptide) pyrophosphoryl-undecaprenol N-acetylglucosamine transferase [Candidatus Vogelbacteria bacterium]